MKNLQTLACASLLLTGCASTIQKWDTEAQAATDSHAAALTQVEKTAATCTGTEDCARKWDAAQVYVQTHSGYRLQTVTSAVIQTFGPLDDGEGKLAFSVTRQPAGEGSYRIVPSVSCYYPRVCGPAADRAAIDFNRAVSAAR